MKIGWVDLTGNKTEIILDWEGNFKISLMKTPKGDLQNVF